MHHQQQSTNQTSGETKIRSDPKEFPPQRCPHEPSAASTGLVAATLGVRRPSPGPSHHHSLDQAARRSPSGGAAGPFVPTTDHSPTTPSSRAKKCVEQLCRFSAHTSSPFLAADRYLVPFPPPPPLSSRTFPSPLFVKAALSPIPSSGVERRPPVSSHSLQPIFRSLFRR